jgi:hypothetical protein
VKGDNAMLEGPISRLNIHKRVEPVNSRILAFMIFAKVALLASILYYFWG